MRKMLMGAAAAAAFAMAAPASATIIMVDASTIQGDNVLFNAGTQTGTSIVGHFNGSAAQVLFSGTTTNGNIISATGGQARVEGELNAITANPNDTYGLTSLFFELAGGQTFNNLEFNLSGNDGGTAVFQLVDNMGDVFNFAPVVLGNGENFFGFQGIDGQSIASVQISINPGSIQDVRQIRLDPTVPAVPEPGTWAMMLLGFGGVGLTVRRSRRRTALAQIA